MINATYFRQREAGRIFILLLCFIFLFAEMINGRLWLSDLEVYYRTAGRLLDGNPLYRYAEDGHYVFKYSPVSAVYFIPLLILPFAAAKVLYWIFLSLIIARVFRNCARCAAFDLIDPVNKTKFNFVLLAGGILFAVHYLRELHLGQVNFLLLACYVWAIILYENNKPVTFGFLLAATIFLKPFGLIFLPWLLLKKRFREIGWTFAGLAILSLLPLIFYRDLSLFASQYSAWFRELAIELGNKQDLIRYANHTIFSVTARYTPAGYLVSNGVISQGLFQLMILIITGLLTAMYILKKLPAEKVPVPAFYDMAFLTALIPLLSFTSENAFLFVLPAAIILLSKWEYLPTPGKITVALGLLLVGGNFSELTGKKLSQWLENWSVLTPGTVLLLAVLFYLRFNFRKLEEAKSKRS